MATKTKAETKTQTTIPAALQEKVDAYAEAHNATSDEVIELALRDFFHNEADGRRPRSNSVLEPVIGVQ